MTTTTPTRKNSSYSTANLNNLLVLLYNMKPDRPPRFAIREQRVIERIASRLLWSAGVLLLILLLWAITNRYTSGSNQSWVEYAALALSILIQCLCLASMLTYSFGMLLCATRWKNIALTTMLRETENDENHARSIASYPRNVLLRAEQHLQHKLGRLERRASSFLGDKTAVLSLLAFVIPLVKETNNMSLLQRIFDTATHISNWEWFAIYFFSFVLGMSLGAIGLKILANRIRYLLEILALAQENSELTKKP